MDLHSEPIRGLPMLPPVRDPFPGDELVGYELVYQQCPVCVMPNPLRMSYGGWLMCALSAAVFLPLACIPCCLSSSYKTSQRPVYMRPEHFRKLNEELLDESVKEDSSTKLSKSSKRSSTKSSKKSSPKKSNND